jgi:hypothetical protein
MSQPPNKYAQPCAHCGLHVEELAGFAVSVPFADSVKHDGKSITPEGWWAVHAHCLEPWTAIKTSVEGTTKAIWEILTGPARNAQDL